MLRKVYERIVPEDIQFHIDNLQYRNYVKKYIKRNWESGVFPMFRYIEIETLNRCNGTCAFCPVNVNEVQRPYAKMSFELFEKIINELQKYGYADQVNLFSNNEPFLDERILEWMKYLKQRLPNARLVIYTNGSMLTMEKFLEAIKYTSKFIIDNYSENDIVNPNLKEIKKYIDSGKNISRGGVFFVMRKKQEVLTSRGGMAPNKKNVKGITASCLYPFKQMIVRPDGKCSLCCNDALGKYTLGNVNTQTLKEIWYSKAYEKIREEMKTNDRQNLMLCNSCDTRAWI